VGALSANQGDHETRAKLAHAVLRQVMADHGIPSDWMECRIIPARSSAGERGMHVQLVAHRGGQRLVDYAANLQQAYRRVLARMDPTSTDWLFGLTWVFEDPEALQNVPPVWHVDAGSTGARLRQPV
jgi:hypothetical protein